MRIEDASYLSNDQSDGALVLPAIEPGELSVLQIEPEDTLAAVLAALEQQQPGRPVIIVLPEQGAAFSHAEDFAQVQQVNASLVSFVIPQDRLPSVSSFASENGFACTSSLIEAQTLFLQQTNSYRGSFSISDGLFQPEDNRQSSTFTSLYTSTHRQAPEVRETSSAIDENNLIQVQSLQRRNPITPLPETPLASNTLRKRPRRGGQIMPIVVIVAVLVIGSATLLPMLFAPSSTSFTLPPQQRASIPASVGQLSFISSGQLDPNSNTGLNDTLLLTLDGLVQPPAGMNLYAWLLADQTQDAIPPILLGTLHLVHGATQLSYQDPQHTDLLVNYSRFLVTQQASQTPPSSPPLDVQTWKYQGAISDIPTPGDEQGYSLLAHMRHLLAKDPELTDLGLAGGLDIWLYRNTGKIFEWSNAARDDWAGNNTALLRREVDRVVEYLDGQVYASRDLPTNTPWLVNPHAGRPGLIDFTTAQDEQGPASYVSHVRLHLAGMINAPGHTDAQKLLANTIDAALTQVETAMKQIRRDAVQLAAMSDTQLNSQHALALLNDMQINANNAYSGQNSNTGGSVPGVVWIHASLQQLAQIVVSPRDE